MNDTLEKQTVNIRPGVSILSILRHLNYKPWFAMAEFVDNSLQSYFQYRKDLESVEGKGFKLRVVIEPETDVDGGSRIAIRDNAAGIHKADYARAFRPAELPPERTDFAEFGMGMKSAACWFAPRWTVRTTALGEFVERTVTFDIEKIIRDDLEDLLVQPNPIRQNEHFTEIVLSQLHKPLQSRTIGKIKEHLASIYRVFLRDDVLELIFDGDKLTYSEPKVLSAPYYRTPKENPTIWRKDLDFDFGLGLRAYGFAALRETSNIATAGFALFRRNRLIEGSADEAYRPKEVFGSSNKFTYQRLFGELHLEGFEVSHTKDGFRWDENEEAFLDILKQELNSDPIPLIDQAEGYRVRVKQDELKQGADLANKRTAETIEREVPPVIEKQLDEEPAPKTPPRTLPPAAEPISKREIEVTLRDCKWKITLELSNDPAVSDWIGISDRPSTQNQANQVRQIGVRLSLAHPFMERFSGTAPDQIEPLLRLAAAICLAEIVARDSGVSQAGTIRRNINELLRDALSKP
jgi:hypothetical protein